MGLPLQTTTRQASTVKADVRNVYRTTDPTLVNARKDFFPIRLETRKGNSLKSGILLHGGEWYLLRTALQGGAGKLLQAAGVAIPPPVKPRPVENDSVVPRP